MVNDQLQWSLFNGNWSDVPRRTAKTTPTTVYLSPSEHRQIKIEAAERDMTITEIVVEALKLRAVNRLATHEDDRKR